MADEIENDGVTEENESAPETQPEVKPEPKEEDPIDTSPNVKFIGTRSRNGEKERMTEAPSSLRSGPTMVFEDLPSSEEQIEGFYYERAAELCRAFPGLYKRIIRKGE